MKHLRLLAFVLPIVGLMSCSESSPEPVVDQETPVSTSQVDQTTQLLYQQLCECAQNADTAQAFDALLEQYNGCLRGFSQQTALFMQTANTEDSVAISLLLEDPTPPDCNAYDLLVKTMQSKYNVQNLPPEGAAATADACQGMRVGEFTFTEGRGQRFIRTEKDQYQYLTDDLFSYFDLEWLSECSYQLTLRETNIPEHEDYVNKSNLVEITAVIGDTMYFTTTLEDGTQYHDALLKTK